MDGVAYDAVAGELEVGKVAKDDDGTHDGAFTGGVTKTRTGRMWCAPSRGDAGWLRVCGDDGGQRRSCEVSGCSKGKSVGERMMRLMWRDCRGLHEKFIAGNFVHLKSVKF